MRAAFLGKWRILEMDQWDQDYIDMEESGQNNNDERTRSNMGPVQTRQRPVVRGEYSRNGYEVWIAGRVVYSAGNHALDSVQPAMCSQERLPLTTLRKFCTKIAREIATERCGRFAGVERVNEEEQHDENQ